MTPTRTDMFHALIRAQVHYARARCVPRNGTLMTAHHHPA
jgi:hypothetical protein